LEQQTKGSKFNFPFPGKPDEINLRKRKNTKQWLIVERRKFGDVPQGCS
jgi:hypothetical protein